MGGGGGWAPKTYSLEKMALLAKANSNCDVQDTEAQHGNHSVGKAASYTSWTCWVIHTMGISHSHSEMSCLRTGAAQSYTHYMFPPVQSCTWFSAQALLMLEPLWNNLWTPSTIQHYSYNRDTTLRIRHSWAIHIAQTWTQLVEGIFSITHFLYLKGGHGFLHLNVAQTNACRSRKMLSIDDKMLGTADKCSP